MFPEWTGLVHISGVDDDLPLERLRDEHRVLVGADDVLGNLGQILALMEGYDGPYAFEPFAASVHDAGDIGAALETQHALDRPRDRQASGLSDAARTAMAKTLDVICIGRSSVDLYGQQVGGRLEEMASFAKYVGGCPTNISIGSARLGLRPGLITAVGDEHMGRFIKEQVRARRGRHPGRQDRPGAADLAGDPRAFATSTPSL